ncbi:MAG TPA: response regulator [Povalibacter sp.]|nr:response regulator [Povalibacter sp.]
MRFFRRSLIALGVAATLPTVVLAAVGVFYFLRTERAQVENVTLGRSATVITLSDSALRGDLRALSLLSASVYFESQDWREFHGRLRRVLAANPHWQTICVFDAVSGEQIFDVQEPLGSPHPMPLPGTETLESVRRATEPVIGGVTAASEPVVHLYVPIQQDGATRFVLVVAVRTQLFQDLLRSQVPGGTVAALIDRYGNFIARTVDYPGRVGKPATRYARDAISLKTQGLYQGTTYEGLKNYTAFQTSDWSGWSAHIAVASTLIDRPTSWSFVVAGAAGLGSLALAAVLLVLVLRDMTERRRADEALRQSQKMEAIGQLTGGIAHDFNNLLTAIIGNLDMIRTRSTGNERLERLAENALDAARRGAKLTSQLLAFSRSQRMQLTTVDLGSLLNGMSSLLSQSVGPAVAVRVAIDRNARFVLSDGNQLELALLNLAVNARDAMPGGGNLTISTHPAIDLDLRHLPRRPYMEIRVADSGVGMSESVRTRAVEPFFTTKQIGHGTGLGLSQVYGVARESGGTLFIESEVGQGTTIRLVLPVAADPAANAYAVQTNIRTPTVPTPAGNPLIAVLVIDDDRQVRRFVSDSLRSFGYQVVDSASGSEGLELLRADRFDLLLVDFAMPGMNGADVARAAQEMQPDLRVLIVSGYADSAAIEAALGATPLLRKPFDVAELGAAVAAILGARESAPGTREGTG